LLMSKKKYENPSLSESSAFVDRQYFFLDRMGEMRINKIIYLYFGRDNFASAIPKTDAISITLAITS